MYIKNTTYLTIFSLKNYINNYSRRKLYFKNNTFQGSAFNENINKNRTFLKIYVLTFQGPPHDPLVMKISIKIVDCNRNDGIKVIFLIGLGIPKKFW